MAHRFDPRHLAHLDSPLRRLLLPPRRILERIGLARGDILLDIGAGSGFFSFPAADIVGPGGFVYAIDIASAAVELLDGKRKALGASNVEARLSMNEDLGMEPGSGTVALLCTVLHEVEDKAAMLLSINRALRNGGTLAVVEFRKGALIPGPRDSERIGKEEMRGLFEAAGYGNAKIEDLNAWFYLAAAKKAQAMEIRA
jgi:ubiquinone/menaquinone biosynthesis C-methylase UbiE